MCLVKLPDELNIFSQYLHLKGFLSSVRSFFFLFFFLFFFFFPFFFFFFLGRPRGGCNPPNPPSRSASATKTSFMSLLQNKIGVSSVFYAVRPRTILDKFLKT